MRNRPGDPSPGPPGRSFILTVNGGSSSLKFALFDRADPPARRASGRIERIGLAGTRLAATGVGGTIREAGVEAPDHRAAAGLLVEWVDREVGLAASRRSGTAWSTAAAGTSGRSRSPTTCSPNSGGSARTTRSTCPGRSTSSRRSAGSTRPCPRSRASTRRSTTTCRASPRSCRSPAGSRRPGCGAYGFHGLSYAFLMGELERVAGAAAARGRVVLAHLGAGASLAAVRGGRPVDTTMGFTPASGLVMGTRTGDIDPGLVRFLMRAGGLTVESFHAMVNHESGLLGVSETSPDLRDLLARQGEDVRAAEAVELYCYRVKTGIGALAAALGGLETLVFAGGIGENAPEVRRRVCDGLGFLGVALDGPRNEAGAAVISADGGPVTVRVIRTDEEVVIARAAAGVVGSSRR